MRDFSAMVSASQQGKGVRMNCSDGPVFVSFLLGLLLGILAAYFIFKPRPQRRRVAQLILTFVGPNGEPMSSAGVVHADQAQIVATLSPKDSQGNPVTLTVPPKWTMSDATIASMSVSADGLTATFAAPFTVGTSNIDVVTDAADSDNGQPIHGTGTLQVLPAGVATIDIAFNTPT